MKHTNPWETYLPVGSFRNGSSFVTGPCATFCDILHNIIILPLIPISSKVVWKGSKEMGIAQAKSKSNKIIVVANYDPPGNFVGRYSENVAPPSS